MSKSYRLYCPSCSIMAINGMACHERGCPHANTPMVKRVRGFECPVMFPVVGYFDLRLS